MAESCDVVTVWSWAAVLGCWKKSIVASNINSAIIIIERKRGPDDTLVHGDVIAVTGWVKTRCFLRCLVVLSLCRIMAAAEEKKRAVGFGSCGVDFSLCRGPRVFPVVYVLCYGVLCGCVCCGAIAGEVWAATGFDVFALIYSFMDQGG